VAEGLEVNRRTRRRGSLLPIETGRGRNGRLEEQPSARKLLAISQRGEDEIADPLRLTADSSQ
jgi:hypothetical protein